MVRFASILSGNESVCCKQKRFLISLYNDFILGHLFMQGCTHVYVLYILVGIRTQCLEHVFTLKEKDITYHTRCGLHMYALCPFQYI